MWDCTYGMISKETIDELRLFVLNKYLSAHSHIKVSFVKAFLKHLTKVRFDTRYHAFEVFLERPRTVKTRNNVTSRIDERRYSERSRSHKRSKKNRNNKQLQG
jgi:hypothetical protein